MTQTSAPASWALRASGLRRAQKEKSSATRNKIFQDALFWAPRPSKGTSCGSIAFAGASRAPAASVNRCALGMLRQLLIGRTRNAAIQKAMLAADAGCHGGWLAVFVPPGLKHQHAPQLMLRRAFSRKMLGPFLANG